MINIILSLNVIIFIFIGNYLWSQRKQILALEAQSLNQEKTLSQMLKDHSVLIHADLLCSRQLRELNSQFISMDKQLQELENKRGNDGGYQHALRILEMGGDRDEIMSSCHLSHAEAELLMNLQAYRSAIKAS